MTDQDKGEVVEEVTGLEFDEVMDLIELAEDNEVLVEGRPAANLVLMILGGLTGACVGAVAYDLIVSGSEASLQILSSIALIGVGAVASLLGAGTTGRDD